ncbi:hypothetical protein DIPPA_04075 [Diplonema papillatum]|nr:hypothetical protein DIPPA_04075 [Diplonema papillatum]
MRDDGRIHARYRESNAMAKTNGPASSSRRENEAMKHQRNRITVHEGSPRPKAAPSSARDTVIEPALRIMCHRRPLECMEDITQNSGRTFDNPTTASGWCS